MGDIQRCPCCKTCEDCPCFQYVNIKCAGLHIYRYSTCEQGINNYTGKNEKSTEIFILHNTKKVDIASAKLIPKLANYKKCPRCKYILEHAEKFLLNIPTINKLDVLGMCDKCRSKDRKVISSCECGELIKKFFAIQELKKNEFTKGTQLQKLSNRFTKKDEESETLNFSEFREGIIPFSKTAQKNRFTRKHYSDTEVVESDAEITKFGSNIKLRKSLYSDAKIQLTDNDATYLQSFAKSGKQYPLRRISKSEESLYTNLHNLIDKSKNYSLRPSTHVQKTPRFNKYEVEPYILDLEKEKNRDGKEFNKKETHDFDTTRASAMSDVGTSILKNKIDTIPSRSTLPKYNSDELFSISLLAETKKILQKDFSYFFIKEAELRKKPIQILKSSSELIKDTRDVLLAREEDLKRKYNEEFSRNLDEHEKKRKSREEKLGFLKERKTISDKDNEKEKVSIEERKSKMREGRKNVLEKLDVSSKKTSVVQKLSKDMQATTEKSKKSGIKAEHQFKQELEANLRLEKDRKMKEKEKPKKELGGTEKATIEKVKKKQSEKESDARDEKKDEISRNETQNQSKELKGKSEKEKDRRIDDNLKKGIEKRQVEPSKIEAENKKGDSEDKKKAKEQTQSKELKAKSEKEKDREIDDNLKKVIENRQVESSKIEAENKKGDSEDKKKVKAQTQSKKLKGESEKEKDRKIDDNLKKGIDKRQEGSTEIEAENKKGDSGDKKKAKGQNKSKELKGKSEKEKDRVMDDNLKKIIEKQQEEQVQKEVALNLQALQEMKPDIEDIQRQPKPEKNIEKSNIKELNINEIKIRPPPQDDLILQLVQMKQVEAGKKRDRPRDLSEIHIPLTRITNHMDHKNFKLASCAICNDSELEIDIEEILFNKTETMDINNVIIGKKIFKYKQPLMEKSDEKQTFPKFISTFDEDLPLRGNNGIFNADDVPEQLKRPPVLRKNAEQEPQKGVIRYALSDRTFIEKGWTMLPTEKVVRKMNVYRMRPAHPEFDWFEHNKNKKIMHYDTGEKLAEFDDDGRARLYYRSGRLALDYYNAEEIHAQQRFVIHSSGEPDARGCSRPLAILATFDYLGNGIVFDHTGKIRLKYNQTEGVVLDRSIGPVSHWKWHTLNDPPVLQQVMIDTQMAHKDPDILKLGGPSENKTRPDNEEMLAIEFDNFIKEKSKKLSQKFKPFQIKMKALKINEHFSLRVLDQATLYLIFRDGSTNLKINLGMILDHQEIVDTDTAEVGEVSNSLERFPARTDSLAGLQNSVAYAQRIERARIERERRLRPTQPCSSIDRLTAATSRPLRTALRTVASEATVATCRCRKPSSNNLYYDTRLV